MEGNRVERCAQLTTPDSVRLSNCDLSHAERDRMIRMVTETARTRYVWSSSSQQPKHNTSRKLRLGSDKKVAVVSFPEPSSRR